MLTTRRYSIGNRSDELCDVYRCTSSTNLKSKVKIFLSAKKLRYKHSKQEHIRSLWLLLYNLYLKNNQPSYSQICQASITCNCFFPVLSVMQHSTEKHSYCKYYTIDCRQGTQILTTFLPQRGNYDNGGDRQLLGIQRDSSQQT
jgi:hypothetical protein